MDYNIELYQEKSEILKVLAHPIRLCIVRGLMQKESCNVTYMEECLHVSQSSVSQHLSKLKAAGIVKCIRVGNEKQYQISDKSLQKLISDLFEEERKD